MAPPLLSEGEDDAVLLVGHYGAPNVGDEAMLLGLVLALRERSDVPLIVSTKTGSVPQAVAGIARLRAVRRGVFSDLALARRVRWVVFGGGTHFHDQYRGIRLLYHYASLLRYVAIMVCGQLGGGVVVWLGMGVGPLDRAFTRTLCRLASRLPASIVVRDAASLEVMHRVGRSSRVVLGFDLAALIPRQEGGDPVVAAREQELVIGFAPASVRADPSGSIFAPLADGLAAIAAARTTRVRLFTFSGSGPDGDRTLVSQLASRWTRNHGLACEVVDTPGDPVAVMSQMRSCDVVVAVRFHSLLMAFMTRRPAIALCYQEKVRQLAQELGLDERLTLPLDEVWRLSDGQLLLELATDGSSSFRKLNVEEARARAEVNLEALVSARPHLLRAQ